MSHEPIPQEGQGLHTTPPMVPEETDESIVTANDIIDTWGNPNTLNDHFLRHGGDFNSPNEEAYAEQAHEFYQNRANYQVKIAEDGTIRVYDSSTNTFGSYNADGTTRTFFKPSGGQDYFDRQPGS